MPVPRRSISSARDMRDVDKVLKERQQGAPRPAFTTLFHKRADLTPAAASPITPRGMNATGGVQQSPRLRSASGSGYARTSSAAGGRSGSATSRRPVVGGSPRTPAPASTLAANNNFALLVARDVSRQPENAEELRRARIEQQYQLSVNRRYDVVVDEAEVMGKPHSGDGDGDDESDPGESADGSFGGVAPVRRLIKPVSKVGLRSDYYVPNRKHTMAALKSSSVISRERVKAVAHKLTPALAQAPATGRAKQQRVLPDDLYRIVDFIGKSHEGLGRAALVNRALAAAVDSKMAEEDTIATNDEVHRRLRAAKEGVKGIPKAFFNAIRTLRTNPPQRVMEALRVVVMVVENDAVLSTNPLFDGPAATIAFRAQMGDGGHEAFVKRIITMAPSALKPEVIDAIRGGRNGCLPVSELVEKVASYNPHAGTLCEWVDAIITVASPPKA